MEYDNGVHVWYTTLTSPDSSAALRTARVGISTEGESGVLNKSSYEMSTNIQEAQRQGSTKKETKTRLEKKQKNNTGVKKNTHNEKLKHNIVY